ncbi:hypothetical protein [Streptomyces sp. NPDC060322]|uniref:hypothetical protein n=1 Tax=Streptomyces sp. NPDC060322 TaxID=3347097 RepID=UPI003661FF62
MTQQPEVLVEVTRYSVCVLPRGDINFTAFVMYVQRRRDGWGITDGAGWVASVTGQWTLDHYDALTFAELEDALSLARKLAPDRRINGHTAMDAYRRTHPAP